MSVVGKWVNELLLWNTGMNESADFCLLPTGTKGKCNQLLMEKAFSVFLSSFLVRPSF